MSSTPINIYHLLRLKLLVANREAEARDKVRSKLLSGEV
jgi:hypothetical protein